MWHKLNSLPPWEALLSGEDGSAAAYGTIRYYEDDDITKWCEGFCIKETYGIRTFRDAHLRIFFPMRMWWRSPQKIRLSWIR